MFCRKVWWNIGPFLASRKSWQHLPLDLFLIIQNKRLTFDKSSLYSVQSLSLSLLISKSEPHFRILGASTFAIRLAKPHVPLRHAAISDL